VILIKVLNPADLPSYRRHTLWKVCKNTYIRCLFRVWTKLYRTITKPLHQYVLGKNTIVQNPIVISLFTVR